MGTRNLTAVYIDGEYKVAQYGQWDGYPEGQGLTCLHFLRDEMDAEKFKAALRKCSYISDEEMENLFKQYGARPDGSISLGDYNKMSADHPEVSRDTGAEVLALIQKSGGMKLRDEIKFAADGLFCEWAWVIDFDHNTFEAFTGFHKHGELDGDGDRFAFLKKYEEGKYIRVVLCAMFSLDNLPTDEDFLAAFKEE